MTNISTIGAIEPVSYLKTKKVTDLKPIKVTASDPNSKRVTELEVKIPLAFDLKTLPNTFKKRKKRGYDYYAYLVGLMVHKAEQRRISYGTYFGFSSTVLRELMRGDYYIYINALKDAGYIKEFSDPYTFIKDGKEVSCKGTYKLTRDENGKVIGKTAKKYALNLDLIRQGDKKNVMFTTYTITDKSLIDKINRRRIKNTEEVVNSYPTAKRVFDSIKQVSILEDEALEHLNQKYDLKKIKEYGFYLVRRLGKDGLKKFISEMQATKDKRKLKAIFKSYGLETSDYIRVEIRKLLSKYNSLNTRLHAINTLSKISAGEYENISISRDHKTGRLFHNLTMLPKDLKPFVRLCGQPLVEIDGSNAQWWLLHGYIKNLCNILDSNSFLGLNKGSLENPLPILRDNYLIEEEGNTINPTAYTYMLHTFSKEEDYLRYKEGVQRELYTLETMLSTNSFRQYFIEAYKKKGLELDEGKVKANLIKYILFGNVNREYYHNSTIVKLFKERYPIIHGILKDLKTKYINHNQFGYEMRDQWKCLALILQSKEASIFVEEMMFTDAIFMTSHDAIVTNEDNISKVEKTLTEALKRANTKMRLGIKYWVKDYNDIQRSVSI